MGWLGLGITSVKRVGTRATAVPMHNVLVKKEKNRETIHFRDDV